MPDARLGPGLPQRRPRRQRPRRARVRRARRRPGQARRPTDRARRGRRRAASRSRRDRGRGGGQATAAGHPGARRLRRARRCRHVRHGGSTHELREELPAALVPLLALVDELPTRTSGKVDRAALPWPLLGAEAGDDDDDLQGLEGWLAQQWTSVLGARVASTDADFFSLGGGSLSAAQLVSLLRQRVPTVTVADVYDRPRLGAQAELLAAAEPAADPQPPRHVRRIPRHIQLIQTFVSLLLLTVKGMQWVVGLVTATELLRALGLAPWAPPTSWWVLGIGWLAFVTPVGRMGLSALGARILLAGVRPGTYPRGGHVHLRLWAAERFTESMGAASLAGAPWILAYARALGASVGPGVDLHSVPPVTGMLTIGDGASVEPEVDLSGYWMDGDVVHVGTISIGAGATVGARSTIGPDAPSGTTPWSRPAPRCRPTSPRARPSQARRPPEWASAAAAPAGGPRSVRRAARPGCPSTGSRPSGWPSSPSSPSLPGCSCSRPGCRTPRPTATRPGRHTSSCRSLTVLALLSLALLDDPRRAPARPRAQRGLPPGAQPASDGRCGRPSDCSTRPAPCSSRSTRAC